MECDCKLFYPSVLQWFVTICGNTICGGLFISASVLVNIFNHFIIFQSHSLVSASKLYY